MDAEAERQEMEGHSLQEIHRKIDGDQLQNVRETGIDAGEISSGHLPDQPGEPPMSARMCREQQGDYQKPERRSEEDGIHAEPVRDCRRERQSHYQRADDDEERLQHQGAPG